MKSQALLPGTLPPPAEARSALANARKVLVEKSFAADALKRRAEAAKLAAKKAEARLSLVEQELLDTGANTPEELAASAEWLEALADRDSTSEAVAAFEGKAGTLAFAHADVRAAEEAVSAARATLRAIAEGWAGNAKRDKKRREASGRGDRG
jgi:hypothetical protein